MPTERQRTYYDKLRAKWPELGAPAAPAEAIAAMRAARAVPEPVAPPADVKHWVSPVGETQIAEAAQDHRYAGERRAWHRSWSGFWERPEIKAKRETLNAAPMVDGEEKTGRLIVAGSDGQGRQILEPETRPVKVPGQPWWATNGYPGPIGAADLEAIFERHGEVLS